MPTCLARADGLPRPNVDQFGIHSVKHHFITIVSGLPRSGTSLMMQMLAGGGIPPVTDHLRQADEDNPRGYFEFDLVKRLRTDQSWLDMACGHAVKIIHLLLRELPTDGRFQYRVLLMKRSLEEVIASQSAMLARAGKASADPATLTTVFRSQLAEVERWLGAHPCFAVFPIEYHRAVENPAEVARDIDAFLGSELDQAAMVAAVDASLYRQRSSKRPEVGKPSFPEEI